MLILPDGTPATSVELQVSQNGGGALRPSALRRLDAWGPPVGPR